MTGRNRYRLVALVILLVLLGVLAMFRREVASAGTLEWPISAVFTVSYQAEVGPDHTAVPLTNGTYRFEGESWRSWTMTALSGPEDGLVRQIRPDGTYWEGDAAAGMVLVNRDVEGEGRVPLPDLALGTEVSVALAEAGRPLSASSVDTTTDRAGTVADMITFDADLAAEIAGGLALDDQAAIGYGLHRPSRSDVYEIDPRTDEPAPLTGSFHSRRVVDATTGITLWYEETFDGYVIRRFVMDSFKVG